MKPSISPLAVALAAILAGGLAGYLGGALTRPHVRETTSHATPGEMKTSAPLARLATRVFEPVPLPEVAFTDVAQLDAFVTGLVRDGFSEKHARWVALRSLSGRDMAASLALAREQKALDLWASGAAEVNPEQAFKLLEGVEGRERSSAQAAFFAALGRLDPQAGLGFLARLKAGFDSSGRSMSDFFRNWASVAPFETVAGAVKDLPSGERRAAMNGLFKAWGETDREGMLEWASARGPREAKLAMRSLYDPKTIRNPEELFDLTTRYPAAMDWFMLAVATDQLADRGADGFRAIAELPPGPLRTSTISRFASNFARRDPEGAWKLMDTLPPEDQAQFLDRNIYALAKVRPREVAEKLASGEFGVSSFPSVMEEWGRQEPRQAFDWSRRNLTGSGQLESLGGIFSAWARKAPAEAAAALHELPAGLRASALPSVAAAFGATDPRAALAWAEQLPQVERSRVSGDIVSGWGARDPRAALDYAQKLTPSDRSRVITEVIGTWANNDLSAAAAALASLPPDGLENAYRSVGDNLAQKNPEQAMKWGASISDPKIGSKVIRTVMLAWAGKDPATASAYADTLPAGELRDGAASGLATALRRLDPESAAAWANAIAAPKQRQDNLRAVLRSWKVYDRDAAFKFAQQVEPGLLREEMINLVNDQ